MFELLDNEQKTIKSPLSLNINLLYTIHMLGVQTCAAKSQTWNQLSEEAPLLLKKHRSKYFFHSPKSSVLF